MAMNLKSQLRLRSAGFMPWEITEFAEALAPDKTPQVIDLTSETWKQAIETRENWIKSLKHYSRTKLNRNLTYTDINRLLVNWLNQDKTRTPFDLIKAEYSPKKTLTDYQSARKKRAVASKQSLYRRRPKKKGKYSEGKPYG